ncbi:MAG TPA: hypothetical protein VK822_04235, partial [Acetobacteraceae bacterium]|nr:hypothetical protein [Acetobacteraceae bacterium]
MAQFHLPYPIDMDFASAILWLTPSPLPIFHASRQEAAMLEIETTPAAADRLYATMADKIAIIRRRSDKPLTLADKVLLGHLDAPETQEIEPGRSHLSLRPDRVVSQDVFGQSGMLQFMQTRRDRVAVPTTIHCDHLIQARTGASADLRDARQESREVFDFLR